MRPVRIGTLDWRPLRKRFLDCGRHRELRCFYFLFVLEGGHDAVRTNLKMLILGSTSLKVTGSGSWQLPKQPKSFPVHPHMQRVMYVMWLLIGSTPSRNSAKSGVL